MTGRICVHAVTRRLVITVQWTPSRRDHLRKVDASIDRKARKAPMRLSLSACLRNLQQARPFPCSVYQAMSSAIAFAEHAASAWLCYGGNALSEHMHCAKTSTADQQTIS